MAAKEAAVEEAEAKERTTRGELDVATSKRAELECQASAAQSDADSARIAATSAEKRLGMVQVFAKNLLDAGRSLSGELKKRLDVWDKVLEAPSAQALPNDIGQLLEEALAGDVAPTFAQATCRVEEAPRSEEKQLKRKAEDHSALAAQPTVAAIDLEFQSAPPNEAHAPAPPHAEPGCSTAWSLEVMEVDPLSKKLRTS